MNATIEQNAKSAINEHRTNIFLCDTQQTHRESWPATNALGITPCMGWIATPHDMLAMVCSWSVDPVCLLDQEHLDGWEATPTDCVCSITRWRPFRPCLQGHNKCSKITAHPMPYLITPLYVIRRSNGHGYAMLLDVAANLLQICDVQNGSCYANFINIITN